MKSVKILQCGDMHFDTPFKELDSIRGVRSKEELLEVFSNIVEIARDESVEVLLITGDVFDNSTVSKSTLHFIKDKLASIPDIRVFISPGNHDPYNINSFYKLVKWSDNVHIFTSDIEKVYIQDLNLAIWGAAFTEKYVRKSFLKDFKVDNDNINIMVLHGDIAKGEEENPYNPLTTSEISNSKLDYLALGHRHGFSGIQREGNTYYAYAGCPQGRGFDELGNKGIIIGEVSKGAVSLEFKETSYRKYNEVEVDITGARIYEEIRIRVLSEIKDVDRKIGFYKIILKGEIDSEFSIEEKQVEMKLRGEFYFVKVKDNTDIKIDYEEVSKDYSVKGIFAKKMLDKINTCEVNEKDIVKLALKLGMQSLSEEEVKLDDY